MSSTESVSPDDVIVCARAELTSIQRAMRLMQLFPWRAGAKWQTFLGHVAAEDRADELELELDESAISAAAEEFRLRP